MGVGSGLSSLSALSPPPPPLYFLPLQIFEKGLEPPFCNGVWHLLVHWHPRGGGATPRVPGRQLPLPPPPPKPLLDPPPIRPSLNPPSNAPPPPPPQGASGQQLVGGVVGVQNQGVAPPGTGPREFQSVLLPPGLCEQKTPHKNSGSPRGGGGPPTAPPHSDPPPLEEKSARARNFPRRNNPRTKPPPPV